jgi:hypothetical protein
VSARDLASLARENIEAALQVAREIMLDPFAEDKDRLRAVEFFADRGYGKAAQAVIAVPMNKRLAQELFGMSNDDLLQIIDQERPRLAAPTEPVIDAEVVESIDPLLL